MKNSILYFRLINSWSAPSSGLRPPSPPISGEKGQALYCREHNVRKLLCRDLLFV